MWPFKVLVGKVGDQYKWVRFGLLGCVSAFVGSYLGVSIFGDGEGIPFWDATTAFFIGYILNFVQARSLGNPKLFSTANFKSGVFSALAGASAGGLFIATRSVVSGEDGHLYAWVIEGLIIGFIIGGIIPNLSRFASGFAGLVAGLLGFYLLKLFSGFESEYLTVASADSLKGGMIGLLVSFSEKLVKKTTGQHLLFIQWSAGEQSTLLLGSDAIRFGTSDKCQVFLKSDKSELPVLAEVRTEGDKVVLIDFVNDNRILLDESKPIKINELRIWFARG